VPRSRRRQTVARDHWGDCTRSSGATKDQPAPPPRDPQNQCRSVEAVPSVARQDRKAVVDVVGPIDDQERLEGVAIRLRYSFSLADHLDNQDLIAGAVGLVGKDASTDYRLIALIAGGLAVYELLQGPMGGAIDPQDIVASLVAGVVCVFMYRALNRHPVSFEREPGP